MNNPIYGLYIREYFTNFKIAIDQPKIKICLFYEYINLQLLF